MFGLGRAREWIGLDKRLAQREDALARNQGKPLRSALAAAQAAGEQRVFINQTASTYHDHNIASVIYVPQPWYIQYQGNQHIQSVYNNTSTTMSAHGDRIWTQWYVNQTAASTATTAGIWTQWSSQITDIQVHMVVPARARITDEELRQANERAARWNEQQREVTRKREQAEERASGLLREHLTPDQLFQFNRDKYLIIEGQSGIRYRLRWAVAGNIDVLRPGSDVVDHRLCVYPMEDLPVADVILGQKLFLEHREQDLLRVANRS